MGAVRASLRRWHMWLGWLVGLADAVLDGVGVGHGRPSRSRKCAAPICCAARAAQPDRAARHARRSRRRPVACLKLEPRAAGPRWVIQLRRRPGAQPPGRSRHRALLPAARRGRGAARSDVALHWHGASVVAVTRVDAGQPADRASAADRRVAGADGATTRISTSMRGSGEIVARRTRLWRFYDFMWGLHIMDLQGRKETNNPWIVTFSLARRWS